MYMGKYTKLGEMVLLTSKQLVDSGGSFFSKFGAKIESTLVVLLCNI